MLWCEPRPVLLGDGVGKRLFCKSELEIAPLREMV